MRPFMQGEIFILKEIFILGDICTSFGALRRENCVVSWGNKEPICILVNFLKEIRE
jgi:hypothetical protein